MKTIVCGLAGVTPLLMNSPKSMLSQGDELVKKTTTERNREEEAEKLAYRTSKGTLYVPATAIKGCIINASSYKKVGKYSLKPLIAGGVRITPDEVEVKEKKGGKVLKDYDIDLRTVVIQRQGRVLKARPKIVNWYIEFEIKYNDNLIGDDRIIKQTLTEGGERVGLLDFSPRNKGDFGTFEIVKWEKKK